MTGKTHAMGGMITSIAVVDYLNHTNQCPSLILTATFIGSALIGSLLPDLDNEKSTISKVLWFVTIILKIIKKIMKILGVKGLEHRCGMHSLVIPTMLISIGMICFKSFSVTVFVLTGITIGYLSHLFLDMFNPMGISLFFPLYKQKIRFLPKCIAIKTGGAIESVIFGGFTIATMFLSYLIFSRYYL